MSEAAYDHEDLRHLVDRLTPGQVQCLRLLVRQDEELSRAADQPAAQESPGARLFRHETSLTRH